MSKHSRSHKLLSEIRCSAIQSRLPQTVLAIGFKKYANALAGMDENGQWLVGKTGELSA